MIHAVGYRSGQRIVLEGKHPRKELLAILGRKHADKIYRDTKHGTVHVGYIVDGEWWTFYNVTPWQKPA